MSTALPPSTTLLCAELLDRLLHHQVAKKTGFDFVRKRRGERTYWYLQHVLGSRRKQYFLGEETEELLVRMDTQRTRWREDLPAHAELERLSAMAVAGGCMSLVHPAYKVLAALEQAGLFAAGAVLVGSYAFQAHGNMLGYRWGAKTWMTQDADLAASRECMIAVRAGGIADLRQTVIDAGLGIRDIPMLDPKAPSTSFKIRGTEFRVDILTPLIGKPVQGPINVPGLGAYAAPIRYLDYLLEDTQKAVLLGRDAILVNVPSPARFALHKLVVADRRPTATQIKAKKDRDQAEQLLRVLLEIRPGDISLAADAALTYHAKKFLRDLQASFAKLPADLSTSLRSIIKDTKARQAAEHAAVQAPRAITRRKRTTHTPRKR